ncbi:tRNA 2-selenouridine(34) synthase MnmH [soil metagenome]
MVFLICNLPALAVKKTNIEEFLLLAQTCRVFDVRSEGEFEHAHIPGAYSLPLFNNEERKVVGTTYKQQSREAAIKVGLDMFGGKMRKMIEEVEAITKNKKQETGNNTILIHCWRGGMRSAGVAWLLDLYGFKVYTLIGGYKAFRNWTLHQFTLPYSFKILGGYTGSGKTYLIQELQKAGNTTIDLEGLACHKGSAFGALGEKPQPSQEMFENMLAIELWTKASSIGGDAEVVIWLEDESQRIGTKMIPKTIWEEMRLSPVAFLDIPFEERLKHIVSGYGNFDKEQLEDSIQRIQKRLGGMETKNALNYLEENNMHECFAILLKYYDKLYSKGLHSRPDLDKQVMRIHADTVTPDNFKKLTGGKVYE